MDTINRHSVIWNALGRSSLDSMPIGNGDIGLNVWTEQNGDLVFYLSKTDAWSENGRLLKLGKVRISLDPNPFTGAVSFAQMLLPEDGKIIIDAGSGVDKTRVAIWVDANHPAVNIKVQSASFIGLKVSVEPWRTERRELVGTELISAYGVHGPGASSVFVEPDTMVSRQTGEIIWYHRNERSIWKANLELQALGELAAELQDPLLGKTFGALLKGDGLISESDTVLRSDKARKEYAVAVFPLTAQCDSADDWFAELESGIKQIEGIPRESRMEAHRAWWRDFWSRSYIHVSSTDPREKQGAEQVSIGYALQRWMNACSGRGNSPIKFNGSIFNVDTMDYEDQYKGFDADFRLWGGCYWWQNTRLLYWPMLAAGDYDLMKPLFRMYRETLPLRRVATKKYYGHAGAFIPETIHFWGAYNDCNYGRDRENMSDGLTENTFIRYYWQSGLELSLMMLDYYNYTKDRGFAEKTMLPFAREIITFYDRHWGRDAAGKIHFEPAMALETYREAVNPLVEIVGIAKVCRELLSLPDTLVSAGECGQWERLISELPDIPMRETDDGKVLIPAEQYNGKQNVENPELYAIFPYRAYGVGKDGLKLARRTFEGREFKDGGCWRQDAIKAACLGLADEAAEHVVRNLAGGDVGDFIGKDARYRFDAMWGPGYDWTPDLDHGGVATLALQKMLLQCDGDEIHLLPAWPRKWDVDFKLHAPHNTVVEGSLSGGKVVDLKATPPERRKDVIISGEYGQGIAALID